MNNPIPTFLEDLGFSSSSCPDGIEPNSVAVDENHVVSRDKTGRVVSRFKNVQWDFTHYATRQLRLNFTKFYQSEKINGGEVYRDLKVCSLYLFYHPNFRAMRTVETAARQLFLFADNAIKKNISFRQSLDDLSILEDIESDKALTDSEKYRKLSGILCSYNRLAKLSALFPSFDFSPAEEVYSYALKYSRLFKKNREINQTPIIPTRLLSELITEFSYTLSSVFSETTLVVQGRKLLVYEVIDELLGNTILICRESSKDGNKKLPESIDNISSQTFRAKRWTLRFSASQERFWIALRPFGINNFKELKTFFSYFFLCGRGITQIFTGMRFEEASNVPYNGFKSVGLEQDEAHFIQSWTTKLESESARFATWFTSNLFVDFNKAIQALVKVFYSKYKGINIDDVDQSVYPLFPAILGQTQTNPFFNYPSFQKFLGLSGWRPHEKFTSDPKCFLITDEDMSELIKQDSAKDWQDHGFKVGEVFPFASHQFRRSLVVYAARSGLVSLPSLQSNLQHLTQTMTAYYANGASYAKNFILEKEGESDGLKSLKAFVNEFQDEMLDAEVDSIWEEIIETEDVLFGSYGSFIQRKKNSDDMPTIFDSRDKIRKAVKKGRLAYKRTPLGGCSSVSPCEKAAFTSITSCVLCENAVFNSISATKLEKTRHNLELNISKFDPNSPFALQIQKEINAIDSVLSNRIKITEVRSSDA